MTTFIGAATTRTSTNFASSSYAITASEASNEAILFRELLQKPFFRHLSDTEKEELTTVFIEARAERERYSWGESFWANPPQNILGAGLSMYADNVIDEEQLGAIILFDSARASAEKFSSAENVKCYYGKEAIAQLTQSLINDPLLSDEWVARVTQAIDNLSKQLPPEDFCIIQEEATGIPLSVLGARLRQEIFFPKLQPKGFDSQYLSILPPKLFRLLQIELFKEQAITPVPILGHPEKPILRDPSKRIMSIMTRFAEEQEVHEEWQEQPSIIYLHDMWHVLVDSANPHRKIFIEIAQLIKEQTDSLCLTDEQKSTWDKLRIVFLDRAVNSYIRSHCHKNYWETNKIDKTSEDFQYQLFHLALKDLIESWTTLSMEGEETKTYPILNLLEQQIQTHPNPDRFVIPLHYFRLR